MAEQMAIIKDVGFGCRDVGSPVLWFSAYISSSEVALQVLSVEQAVEIIKEYGVYDVHKLEGKPCLVEVSSGLIKFLKPIVI